MSHGETLTLGRSIETGPVISSMTPGGHGTLAENPEGSSQHSWPSDLTGDVVCLYSQILPVLREWMGEADMSI